MEIRALLFDFDGTIADSLQGIEFSIDCALRECGMPARERDLRPLIGPPIRTIFSQLVSHADEQQLLRLERAFRASYDSAGWRKTALYDGAVETLTKLKTAGLPLFLLTNKPLVPTRHALEALGIDHLFTAVLCRNSREPSFQSKAEMLESIIRDHKLDPLACLYVGDTSEDYFAATQAGIPAALVAHGYGELNTRTAYPDCTSLNSLSELLDLVEVMEVS